MIRREDLAAIADSTGLTAPVVEKDYVLGWLLHGIYRHPALRESRRRQQRDGEPRKNKGFANHRTVLLVSILSNVTDGWKFPPIHLNHVEAAR